MAIPLAIFSRPGDAQRRSRSEHPPSATRPGDKVLRSRSEYTGVDQLPAQEFDGPVEVFDLNGVKVSDTTENLAKGIYVVRQGSAVKKIVVK